MAISVLLVDDHAMVREGLARLLGTQPDLEVVGSFSEATEALAFATSAHPAVAVLDVALPGLDGIEAARLLHDACPDTRCLILSMHASSEYVYQALRAGASGYVLKESAGRELIEAIRVVDGGKVYLSEKISADSLAQYLNGRAPEHPLERITARERQVLKLIVEGHTSNEVGKLLGLSPKSVDTYRSRLMLKLGISDLPGLVKFAIRHGLTTV
ncbi:MAG TPA: response regulator transcription factor [Burkholderiales bacterium]|nr:response regulator transcription factor [Burkholderiales bacterium]